MTSVDVFFCLQLVNAPAGAISAPAANNKVAQAEVTENHEAGGIDEDLQARLDNLRRM